MVEHVQFFYVDFHYWAKTGWKKGYVSVVFSLRSVDWNKLTIFSFLSQVMKETTSMWLIKEKLMWVQYFIPVSIIHVCNLTGQTSLKCPYYAFSDFTFHAVDNIEVCECERSSKF